MAPGRAEKLAKDLERVRGAANAGPFPDLQHARTARPWAGWGLARPRGCRGASDAPQALRQKGLFLPPRPWSPRNPLCPVWLRHPARTPV